MGSWRRRLAEDFTWVEVIFYETPSLEVWKMKYGPAAGRTHAHPPIDTLTATFPLLAEVDEPADEDAKDCQPPVMRGALRRHPWRRPVASPEADETQARRQGCAVVYDKEAADRGAGAKGGSSRSPVDRGAADTAFERGAVEKGKSAGGSTRGEQLAEGLMLAKQQVDDKNVDKEEELSAGEESTNSNVVDVPLDPDIHDDPKHRWDIAMMTVKEALASWKCEAVKVAMDEEIRSLISMST
ncbi:unnamed protein product [Closterium sp. NIES-53]